MQCVFAKYKKEFPMILSFSPVRCPSDPTFNFPPLRAGDTPPLYRDEGMLVMAAPLCARKRARLLWDVALECAPAKGNTVHTALCVPDGTHAPGTRNALL